MPVLIALGILALVSCSGGHKVAALVQPLTRWWV